jgi:hypothetical protein
MADCWCASGWARTILLCRYREWSQLLGVPTSAMITLAQGVFRACSKHKDSSRRSAVSRGEHRAAGPCSTAVAAPGRKRYSGRF